MSIQKGNEYFRQNKYREALEEYKKIDRSSPLYEHAQFNIRRIKELEKQNLSVTSLPLVDISTSSQQTLSKQPLVSVIMPVFNVAPYLDASILSVLSQSYQNLELIIVNDASTDNGIDIIRMYEAQDSRIVVIDLEFNTLGGAGIPSNIGMDAAQGEFIAFADSDDIIDKFAIEKMVQTALDNDAEVVIADFCNFSDESRLIETAYDKKHWKKLPIGSSFRPEEYTEVFQLSAVPWRKLYKREFLNLHSIRYPEGDYFYEDNPLHWFVLSQAKSIVLLDYVVAFHRMGREGQTMGADNYKLSALYCHINTIKKYFDKTSVSEVLWNELLIKSASYDWILRQEKNERVLNLLKKRNAQLIDSIIVTGKLDKNKIKANNPYILNKRDSYYQAKKEIDLTIVVPVFNCEDLLRETLNHLTKIKRISTEIFLMDDGSTDASKEICQEFADKHNSFFFFKQKNKGAGVARNALIPLIHSKYAYFLDADDTLDVNALSEAVEFANAGNHDLTLFKYKIHFFEKNIYKEMFDSDKKIWSELLKAKSNKEKQILASGMINYPWIRIIKTSLLHDENIFFGKTVVHNDVPYHWHSIISAKNIGVFNKSVCNHRKFDKRAQITNISDKRRMMVFEAYRHTQSILIKYPNFINLYPQWKKFIANLFNWASNLIPSKLQTQFTNKKIIILNQLDKLYREETEGQKNHQIGFYRIIGNSIPSLHSDSQALTSLMEIVEKEGNPSRFDKYFVLNRIVSQEVSQEIIGYLNQKNLNFLEIEFEITEYKKFGYDLKSMPNSYFWFQKKSVWNKLVQNTAIRRFKNSYLMNNNGARNFALLHGKERYEWTMPWDGNCFMPDQSFEQLLDTLQTVGDYKYVVTPMERLGEEARVTSKSSITNATEEPQITFRKDALEIFNEDRVYGNQPKVELFKRLGIKGVWDEKVNLYPWEKLKYIKSPDSGMFVESSGVFRLFSGSTNTVTNGDARSHARSRGIIDFIDTVEASYIRENFKKFNKNKIYELLVNFKSEEQLKKLFKNVFESKKEDLNKINSKDRVIILIYAFCKGMLNNSFSTLKEETLRINEDVQLSDLNIFTACLNNGLTTLLIQLSNKDFVSAVKTKLNLVMLLYYYFDNKDALEFKETKHLIFIYQVIINIFESLFEYDVLLDLNQAGVNLERN